MSKDLGKQLLRRRVPQFLGVYLAAGWAVLEFTDFLVNRYILSPHLTDFALLAWALMIPSVAMVAWYHGAPGRDRWTRAEQIGIPANLAIAAVVLIVAFSGKELGAATESVTLEDETGETVERLVPKSEFRKNLIIYAFDNASGDTALDWLQFGLPLAIEFDLAQDLFLNIYEVEDVIPRLREQGFADGLGVPLTLKRHLAANVHVDYFVAGSVAGEPDSLEVTTLLYDTRRGKLLHERTRTGDDFFELVDALSLQLKHDLELPSQHIEDATDLPVSEIATASVSAWRAYVEAAATFLAQGTTEEVARHLEDAVGRDPQFAGAHAMRFQFYMNLGQTERGKEAAETTMGMLYKLPERVQLRLRAAYYWVVRQDIDKALMAAGMQAELYPEDADAHLVLATLYATKRETERAIASLERVLELDPSRIEMLQGLGQLYELTGDYEQALRYYQQYADSTPEDPRAFMPIGLLYRLQGDFAAATAVYERALVADPSNVWPVIGLAYVDRDLGRFDQALARYEEALSRSATAEQRAVVYEALEEHYRLRGQPRAAIDYMHRKWVDVEISQNPFMAMQERLQNLDQYVAAGMTAVALDSLAAIESRLVPPFDVLLPLGQLNIYLELEEPDSVEAALQGVERFIDAFGVEATRSSSAYARGRAFEMRGQCDQALIAFQRSLELEPRVIRSRIAKGRCYRKLARLQEAEATIQRALTVRPSDPQANYEIALVYADRGDPQKALEHLRTALHAWEEAEPGYKPAADARAKYAELSAVF